MADRISQNNLQTRIERIVRVTFGDNSILSETPEGGIKATASDSIGTVTYEIESDGDVFFSRSCNKETTIVRTQDGYSVTYVDPADFFCRRQPRTKLSVHVDPDTQLTRARALILGQKK